MGKPKATLSLCADNSAFILGKNFVNNKSEIKSVLYPPPGAQVIQEIVYSMRLDRYLVLLSNSSLCIYRRVKETCLLERIQEAGDVRDSEFRRALSQKVTCMELVTT